MTQADLRHSHISLLIDMGFSAVAIADRVGHESIEITYRYAHLFPSKQAEMADRLDDLGKGGVNEELLDTIELIAVILGGLKGESEDGE